MIKTTTVAVWFIMLMAVLTMGFKMISAPDTMVNIIGVLFLIVFTALSVQTKCLTTIRFKRNGK